LADLSPTQRIEIANQLEHVTRWVFASAVILSAIAALDFASGFPFDSWRFDLVLLASAALGLSSLIFIRRLARAARTDRPHRRPGFLFWVGEVVSWALLLVVAAGMGYLIGGRWIAVLSLVFLVVFVGINVLLGVRARKRRKLAH